jgi:MtN3 and saliva related transmembrane protein
MSLLVDGIGTAGAALTTLCWLPQALKVVRERDTSALSLSAHLAFTLGIALWLVYGLALADWPLIGSSFVTLALLVPILILKLRHG